MFIPIITPILDLRIRNNKIHGFANIYLLILFVYFLIKFWQVMFVFHNIFISLLSVLLFPITFILVPAYYFLFENYPKLIELQFLYFYIPLIFRLKFIRKGRAKVYA